MHRYTNSNLFVGPVNVCALSLQDSEKYVEELLTLFNRFSRLVKEAFHDDSRFLTSRDKVRYCQS